MSLLVHFLELLPQIVKQWLGITTEEISFRGALKGTVFVIDDYYRDTASAVVNKSSCQSISAYPNSTK